MTFDNTLRTITVWAITVAVLVPLYVSNSLFFPFISGKNFAFRILVEVAFAAWLILAFRNPEYRPRRSALLWSVLFFIATLGISTLLAESPYKSFWSNFERMEGLIGLIHFALYFLIAGAVFQVKEWRIIVRASLSVNVLIIGYSLLQFFGVFNINQGGVRVDATFGNAIYLGVYALFHLFFALLTAYRARADGKGAWWVGGLAAIALGNIALIFFSATRGIILGLLVGIVVGSVVAACSRSVSRRLRRFGMVGIALALLAVGGFFAARESTVLRSHPIFGRILSASSASDDARARFAIWNISWQGFTERPLFGWGQEGFNFVFNEYYDPALYRREAWFDRAHNVYLDWLVAGGMWGLLGYLMLWFFSARIIMRARDSRGNPLFSSVERLLFVGFGVAYAANNLFVFDNGVSYFLFFMLLAYVHSRGTERAVPILQDAASVSSGALARLYAPAILVALAFSLYWFNARPIYAGSLLIDALRAHQGGPSENLTLFRRALALDTFANAEIREQLAQVTVTVAPIAAVPLSIKQEFLSTAASELDKEIKKRPNDARYYTFMGSLLDAFGLYDQAFMYWRGAVEHSPHKQSLLFQIGGNRLNAGKTQDAVSYFKTAYELNPENRDAVIIYAVGLIYVGDRAEEKRVLSTPSYVKESLDDQRLVSAYQANDRVEDAVVLLRAQLARDPDNPENGLRRKIDELLKKQNR